MIAFYVTFNSVVCTVPARKLWCTSWTQCVKVQGHYYVGNKNSHQQSATTNQLTRWTHHSKYTLPALASQQLGNDLATSILQTLAPAGLHHQHHKSYMAPDNCPTVGQSAAISFSKSVSMASSSCKEQEPGHVEAPLIQMSAETTGSKHNLMNNN